MLHLYDQIQEAVAKIHSVWDKKPHAGIILGTGLGNFAEKITVEATLDYGDIPHFPVSTATSHRGRFVFGTLRGLPVMVMEGRFHAYEGYPLSQITLPVRVMKALGAELLVVSQAVGGMNPYYKPGDVMLIDDHINFMFQNPLTGVNDDRLGPRFPDMSAPYDRALLEVAETIARREGFFCPRGVYVGMLGPTYETRAEYRMARRLGGDAAGMSTVPEVIAAQHCGVRVLGLSTITNACSPDQLGETTHEEVVAAAASAGEKLRAIVEAVVTS